MNRALAAIFVLACALSATACKRSTAKPCGAWEKGKDGHCEALRFRSLTGSSGLGEGTAGVYAMIADGEGKFVAAWEAGETGREPFLTVAEEVGESVAVHVASRALPPAMNFGPVLGAGPGKSVTLAWQHQTPDAASIVLGERHADGTWAFPSRLEDALSLPGVWTGNPKLQCVPSGRCLMVWTQAGAADKSFFALGVSERSAVGKPWTRPSDRTDVINPKVMFVDDNDLALGANGEGLVTWYQAGSDKPGGGGVLAVYKSERKSPADPFPHIAKNDTISPRNRDVSGNRGGKAVLPLLGPEGRAAILWSQENSTTLAGDTRTIMVAVRKPDGAWDIPSTVEEGLVEKGIDAFWVQGTFRVDGSLVVVWQEGNSSPGRRVRAAVLAPGSRKLTSPAIDLSTPGTEGMVPSVAYSPRRGVVVAWAERTHDLPFRVLVRKWAPDEATFGRALPVSTADGVDVGSPRVSIGGPNERVIVSWKRGDPTHERIMAGAFD